MNVPKLTINPLYPPIWGHLGLESPGGFRTQPRVEVYYVDQSHALANNNNDGTDPDSPLLTIQQAIDNASEGDWVTIMPGEYDETVTVDKSLTIVGNGGRGAAFIEPSGAGEEGMLVSADDVTIINLGIAGDSAADYALQLGDDIARFRAYECKFEGPDVNVVEIIGAADILFDDCEFCWGGTGIEFTGGVGDFPTQIFVKGCRFHNLTVSHIGGAAVSKVNNLQVKGCIHGNLEDGTPPTKYIDVDVALSTGIIAECSYAYATNATLVFDIAAGVLWVSNMTEAGVTAARPA